MKIFFKILSVVAVVVLIGCSPKEKEIIPTAVPFDKHDRCHICGMVILNYPGAKAEVFVKGEKEPLKFCSVKDGFTYALQPENRPRIQAFYVSDFGNTADVPLHSKMLEASKAIYDVGSDIRGAMGKSILPFASKEAADKFAQEHGGQVVRYDEIDFSVLQSLKSH